jgi:hypothetical protein
MNWTSRAEEKVKPSFFEKKEAKKLLLLGPWLVASARPRLTAKADQNFSRLFSKKEALAYHAS